ncbi:hypothetical protein [Sphingobacterium zeae]|uniref:hypothetical protein n=1 Tax=Sphingobacterium zeae TaxID=1776859 RepID=UPI003617E785
MSLKNILKELKPLFMLGIAVAFVSCSSKDEQIPSPKGAILNVGVKGIEEVVLTKAAASSRINTAAQQIVSLGDVDALIEAGEGSLAAVPQTSTAIQTAENATSKAATSGLRAASSVMDTGVKFRLVIYDDTNALVYNEEVTSGVNQQIQLVAYKPYTWYAVSLNEKNGSMPNVPSSGIIARSSLENKDVLYASGSFDAIDGANYLDIIFKRMTSRIQARLNVRGLFGTIENSTSMSLVKGSSNATVLQMGDFNILTGQFTNVVDVNGAVLASAMVEDTSNPAGTVKVANFFTLNTSAIAANSLKIKFNSLKVTLDDARVRTFNANTYTFPDAYTPTIGSTYAVNIRLIESPVKVKGILWARSNLIYDPSHTDKYRLKSNPGGSTAATKDTEFWNWKSATPTGTSGNIDPCLSVYPANTWRMSTKQEWESIGQPDDKKEILGLLWGAQYAYLWYRDSDNPENTAYDDNELVLSFGGYRTKASSFGGSSVSGSPAGILLGAYATGECHYWTSTNADTNNGYAVKSSFSRLAWLFSWGSVTYPSADKMEGRNIRCVRQIVNN